MVQPATSAELTQPGATPVDSRELPNTGVSFRSLVRTLRAWWRFHRSGSRVVIRGENNRFSYHDSLLEGCRLEIIGNNNTVEILPGGRLWNVAFRLVGENLTCRIGSNVRFRGGQCVLEDSGSRLQIGEGVTFYAPSIVVNEGGLIRFGNDCLFAVGCDVRNSDGHSILDASDGRRINPAKDIVLQDHVWMGTQCQVLKGVTIGSGAIVAARSLVTRDVAPGTLVAGTPVQVLRENVTWDARRL